MEVQSYQREAEEALKGASPLKRKWKKWFSWEAAYRYSSGYGEDYAWAGLFSFAGLYSSLGVPKEVLSVPLWKQPLHGLLYSFQAEPSEG